MSKRGARKKLNIDVNRIKSLGKQLAAVQGGAESTPIGCEQGTSVDGFTETWAGTCETTSPFGENCC